MKHISSVQKSPPAIISVVCWRILPLYTSELCFFEIWRAKSTCMYTVGHPLVKDLSKELAIIWRALSGSEDRSQIRMDGWEVREWRLGIHNSF